MSYVNFNRALTRAQIEALTNATNGKIYFATDGGIYVGNASGVAVQAVLVNDVTVGGSSVVSNGVAAVPAIPDVVEGNPTVPSGTTPSSLTGLKIGTDYYSVTPEVFFAIYGTTTCAEIEAAYNAGKIVVCYYNSNVYYLGTISTNNSAYIFNTTQGTTIADVYCRRSDNQWGSSNPTYAENITNKVTSLSSSSTDTQYPSAKCVYDLLGDVETLLAAI
jgi:hypothetical protein